MDVSLRAPGIALRLSGTRASAYPPIVEGPDLRPLPYCSREIFGRKTRTGRNRAFPSARGPNHLGSRTHPLLLSSADRTAPIPAKERQNRKRARFSSNLAE